MYVLSFYFHLYWVSLLYEGSGCCVAIMCVVCIYSYLLYTLSQMGHQVAGVYTLLMQPPTHQTCVSHSPRECHRPPEISLGEPMISPLSLQSSVLCLHTTA